MVITFNKELGLRCSKNESCSKGGYEAPGQRQRRLGLQKFQTSIV